MPEGKKKGSYLDSHTLKDYTSSVIFAKGGLWVQLI
jgi:hypothetical protein